LTSRAWVFAKLAIVFGFAAWTPTQIRESLIKLASALSNRGKDLNHGRQSR
jgi:hypothetical protein